MKRPTRLAARLGPLLLSLLVPAIAAAHDHASMAVVDPSVSVESAVRAQAASFENVSRVHGYYLSLAPQGRVWTPSGLSFHVEVPFYYLETSGSSELGLGDVMFGVGQRVWRGEGGRAGIDLQVMTMLPSGDAHRGLGMAHLAVEPGAWGFMRWGSAELAMGLSFLHSIGFGSHGAHRHQSLVAPHDMQEFRSFARGRYTLGHGFSPIIALQGIASVRDYSTDPVGSRVSGSAGLSYRSGALQAEIVATVPLTIHRENLAQLATSIAYRF